MKKQTKIIALIVSIIMLVGLVSVIVSAETEPSTILLESNEYKLDDKKVGISKQTVKSNTNEGFSFTLYSKDTGYTKASAKPFFLMGKGWEYDKLADAFATGTYAVHEFDMCTASNYFPLCNASLDVKTGKGTRWVDNANAAGVKLSPDGVYHGKIDGAEKTYTVGTTPYEWHHWIILYDLKNNERATYIDGALVDQYQWCNKFDEGIAEVGSYRWNLPESLEDIDGGYSMGMANYVYRMYNDKSYLADYAKPLDPGLNLRDDEYIDTMELNFKSTTQNPNKENVYEVDGVGYSNFVLALNAAKGGTVKIIRKVPATDHVINSNVTIDRNNLPFKYTAVGFDKLENGQLITFTQNSEQANLKFMDGDTVIEEQTLPIGSKVECTKIESTKVVDGKTFIFKGWTTEKGGTTGNMGELPPLDKDMVYYAVYVEAEYIIYTTSGGEIMASGTLIDVFQQAPDKATIKLYKDVTLENTYNIVKNVTLDLNGFTLSLKDRFTINQGRQFEIKSGRINANNKNLVYMTKTGSRLIVSDCEMNTSSAFTDVREGEVLIRRCTINALPAGYNVFTGGYRGANQIFTIEDTTVNMNRPNADLLGLGRASGEGGTQNTKVICRNVTINGEAASFVRVNNDEPGAKSSKVEVLFDGNCVFNTANSLVKISGIENSKVTFEDGVTFIATPRLTTYKPEDKPVGECIYGDGASIPLRISNKLCVIAPKSDSCKVTWRAGDFEMSDFWKRGVVPEVPVGVGFTFSPKNPITALTQDTVFEGEFVYDKIELLYNLTLYSDFTVNVYIKKTDGIKSIMLGAFEAYDLNQLEVWGDYYVIRMENINPLTLGDEITFRITRMGPKNDVYEITPISIPKYAKAIVEGKFSKESKELVANVINYAKVACESYEKTETQSYKNITSVFEAVTPYIKVQIPTNPDNYKKLGVGLESAQLRLDTSTKLRFNIVPGYTGKITMFCNNGVIDKTFVCENGTCEKLPYIEIDFRAYDLNESIYITVQIPGQEESANYVGSYNIAAYYEASTSDVRTEQLVKALYSYGKSASAYKTYLANNQK